MISNTCKIWQPSNIYPNAVIGNDVSIGAFTEIGPDVVIGHGTRIGSGCFIPKGVFIDEHCFIGPHVCFTNDRYPPSPTQESWEQTRIKEHAAIGAGCIILPGVTVGSHSIVGAGGVVTKDIPDNEIWAGNPAKFIRRK